MVLWFPSMICFVGLILSTDCHVISVGEHLHWHFENRVEYNFVWKHLLGQKSDTAIASWSFLDVFPICKIANEPWKDAFSSGQRLSQYCQITFDPRASTLLRERMVATWGSQLPGATQLRRYCFQEQTRLTGHPAADWLGWEVSLGQQSLQELNMESLTEPTRTNAHWTYGCTAQWEGLPLKRGNFEHLGSIGLSKWLVDMLDKKNEQTLRKWIIRIRLYIKYNIR